MIWDYFIYFAAFAVLLWIIGAWGAWRGRTALAVGTTIAGLLVFLAFIISMWVVLERPPLRTMGETRLWYSFFLPFVGLLIYGRWGYKWILSFSTMLATVFICVNLFKPEIHSKTLMPALQSPWFAPHVIVYMFAYALMGAATLMAVYYLLRGQWSVLKKVETSSRPVGMLATEDELDSLDQLVRSGLAFITFGMLFGALWAKEAWGHYWSWDPKETWAAITWFAYLVYVHYRQLPSQRTRLSLWMLIVAFVLLQMCWWGINYLPSAQGVSVHTYG
ncbi:MAG: cytochrome c biogenesis protein CcsA [Bacteroidales bacterium]|nr:cytochrome c biogenesis protein CcsA [Bacteroidales bacterium]